MCGNEHVIVIMGRLHIHSRLSQGEKLTEGEAKKNNSSFILSIHIIFHKFTSSEQNILKSFMSSGGISVSKAQKFYFNCNQFVLESWKTNQSIKS